MKNIHLVCLCLLGLPLGCTSLPKTTVHDLSADSQKTADLMAANKKLLNSLKEAGPEQDSKEEPTPVVDSRELVEVSASDEEIKKEVGSAQIDEPTEEIQAEIHSPMRKDFLVTRKSKRMDFWIEYFTSRDRDRFQRFLNNGEVYRQDIQKIFRSHGLPEDLYFVGLIESGYSLKARSRASAVGPWQFIKGTGRRYGLRVTSEVDERRNVFKATHAAAEYLKDLFNVFNNWELSLAAYNAGEFGVIRRIMRYGQRDYYVLSKHNQLPKETINYVPKVLAAIHIFKNRDRYGFTLPKVTKSVMNNSEMVRVGRNKSLRALAKKLKISYRDLRALNPELKRSRTPRYLAGTYEIRVPRGLGSLIPAPARNETRKQVIRRTARKTHRVRRGDTLLGIARRYRTSAGRIARLNNLRSWRSKLRVGQRLVVSGSRNVASVAKKHRPIVYRVRRGDNLSLLAKLFKTRVSSIKRANRMKSGRVYVGQKIVLPNTKKVVYTVKKGDHLGKIARKFRQPMAAIVKLNALKKKIIYPGQKLIVDAD